MCSVRSPNYASFFFAVITSGVPCLHLYLSDFIICGYTFEACCLCGLCCLVFIAAATEQYPLETDKGLELEPIIYYHDHKPKAVIHTQILCMCQHIRLLIAHTGTNTIIYILYITLDDFALCKLLLPSLCVKKINVILKVP